MPDYKKRKRNRIFSSPKKPKVKTQVDNDIKMSSSSAKHYQKNNNIKIIEGRKLEKKRKTKNWLSFISIVLILFFVLESVLPGGIIVFAKNTVKTIGGGSYPITLSGSQTINSVSVGNYYYVLSNTHLTAFSSSGKELFNYEHGFENPVLKTSAAGALVYNQGEKDFLLFDINGLKKSIKTQKNILTANISNSGYYSVATVSDKYASTVTVYDKKSKEVYEWYSAEDTVNSVVLSKNGKKIAVSVFNSKNGEFTSKVSVLNFKSADPEFSETYENTLVYGLDSSFGSTFTIITSNKIKVIKWGNYKFNEYKSDYNLSILKPIDNGYLALFNRPSDKTDNKITVLSKNGKLKYEINYSASISDIDVKGSNIYSMSDTDISIIDKDSKLLLKSDIGFGGVNVLAVSQSNALVITDNKIEKIKLQKE